MHVTLLTTAVRPYVITSVTSTKIDDISFLADKTISDQVYFQKLRELEDVLADIYRKDQADNKDIVFLNKLNAAFNVNDTSILGNLKSRTTSIFKNTMTLQNGHDDLTHAALLLDTTEKLFKFYRIVPDGEAFREKASDQFRDHIRDGYFLQKFGLRTDNAGVNSYYQIDRKKVSEYFKGLPADRTLKEIFWFSYSRMHVRLKEQTSNIDAVLKQRAGDCTDFTVLNAFLLRESNYMVDMPVFALGGGLNHTLVITYPVDAATFDGYIERNEDSSLPQIILDYNRMYTFDLKKKDLANISEHMMFPVKKAESYFNYTQFVEKGIPDGFIPSTPLE